MSRQTPFLQRRGDTLFFRIAVPGDLRQHIGWREVTKSLRTAEKSIAVPMALEYAALVKRVFIGVRAGMAEMNSKTLPELLVSAKHKLRLDEVRDGHLEELDKRDRTHREELRRVKLEAEVETLRRVLTGRQASPAITPPAVLESSPTAQRRAPAPGFQEVIDKFLGKPERLKALPMLKKHRTVLPLLLEVVGNKPINEIDQDDINEFFELLGHLPPRWAAACTKQNLSARQLAGLEHELTLGPASFDDTYFACVRPFLKEARKDWATKGFPTTLTLEGIEYLGDREADENKQRAFYLPELRRLFEGSEMSVFAADPSLAHCFWLPHIGLFTGARVNEICQLNPQVDVFHDPESGSWCLWITKETEADERITKSVKTKEARKVPIHAKLIELGFLNYVKRLKSSGAKLLFPAWNPINRRASGNAEKWFRQFLRDTNLRDETNGACILGMHAFRHTLLTYGADKKNSSGERTPLSLFCITGHAQGESPIHATGAGKGYLTLSILSPLHDKARLLNQLDYGLNFFAAAAS